MCLSVMLSFEMQLLSVRCNSSLPFSSETILENPLSANESLLNMGLALFSACPRLFQLFFVRPE